MPGTRFLVHWFILCACLPVECNGMREPKWVLTIVCIVAACRGSFHLHTELYTVQSCATYTYLTTNVICILNLFPKVACFLHASIHDASVTVDRLPFSKAFMWVCLTCLVWFPRSRGFVEQHFSWISESLESDFKDSFVLPLALLRRSFAWSTLAACKQVKV